ncbi:MAG: sigma-54-dependent transcriptional regulator [Planctomycetota bacterium]
MGKHRILLIDDDASVLSAVSRILARGGATIETENSATHAAERLRTDSFDLVLCDIRMPGMSGVDLLGVAREHDSEVPFILMTGHPTLETAIDAVRLGASGYLLKPFNADGLRSQVGQVLETVQLRRENRALRRQISRRLDGAEFVGEADSMQAVRTQALQFARAGVDVLIVGETGTGKELVARMIHQAGPRAGGPFTPVDCGALPEALFESELFGHERGAFTGANARATGLLEMAEGGTFFLDEVLSLPLALQAKLLRVLQQRQFRRVGGKDLIDVDVQVVAACNRDPAIEVQQGRLREDLYYRLNVGRIDLPPLRERAADIPALANHFLRGELTRTGRHVNDLSADMLEVLAAWAWPGNVRELENTIRRALALTPDGKDVTPDLLPRELVEPPQPTDTPSHREKGGSGSDDSIAMEMDNATFSQLRDARLASFEQRYLDTLLRRCSGDVISAAGRAGIPRATLYRMLKRHEIDPSTFRADKG